MKGVEKITENGEIEFEPMTLKSFVLLKHSTLEKVKNSSMSDELSRKVIGKLVSGVPYDWNDE